MISIARECCWTAWIVALALSMAPAQELSRQRPRLRAPAGPSLQIVEGQGSSLAPPGIGTDGSLVYPLPRSAASEAARLSRDTSPAGDGSSADVADLLVVQDKYLDSACGFPQACMDECRVVALFWMENTYNPDGVNVSWRGPAQRDWAGANVEGLPEDEIPGMNGVSVVAKTAGIHCYRVEDLAGGSVIEGSIEVLDDQPFDDVTGLRCEQGVVDSEKSCELSLSWNVNASRPDLYGIRVDDMYQGHFAGSILGLDISGVGPGWHTVEVFGINYSTSDATRYRGCFVKADCEISCAKDPCAAPLHIQVCQDDYSSTERSGSVSLCWSNGEQLYPGGLSLRVDGESSGILPPEATWTRLESLPAGMEHVFSLQGDCGEVGESDEAVARLMVLAESPHVHPIVEESLACTFSRDPGAEGPATSKTTASWTNQDPSLFVNAWLESRPDEKKLLAGTATNVTFEGTAWEDRVVLQFFAQLGDGCYGSPQLECSPAPSYIAGICNGSEKLEISSAIFGLTFLFNGGDTPPCKAACDANGDGEINLSDMIHVLGFLFLGGDAPSTWVDADLDGAREPTCSTDAAGLGCETPHSHCGQ